MGVVATGVHHIHFGAVIVTLGLGGERQALRLLDRQGIHIGTQRNGAAGLGALEDADHAGTGDAGFDFQPQGFQVIGHQLGGTRFLLAQLGMLVNVAAPLDQLRLDRGGVFAHLLFKLWAGMGTRAEQQTGHQREGKRIECKLHVGVLFSR